MRPVNVERDDLALARNVNVVKPLRRDEPASRCILDPKFSRALDLKLRRLKEKEFLEANLHRPPRSRPRRPPFAASDPALHRSETLAESPTKVASRFRPRGDAGDRPRFVTTVKTGSFLLPPPELARLLALESLYPPRERDALVFSYASKPEAVAKRSKRALAERDGGAAAGTAGTEARKRSRAGRALRGVRALVAAVAGVQLAEESRDGSMTAGAAGAQASNLMHDKRVVRGSTFAAHPQAAGDGAESAAARAARTRRRALARRAALARLRPGTPPPAPGRRHHPIQTEYFLEELFDKGVELEVGVQTDLFADRPPTPPYVPAKTGADAATQIYPGDLFDFDLEVQPILEVLIGKTVEQALAEVAQEEELAALREQQRRYRELRDTELAERQRLAAHDLRLQHEKERRVAEGRAARAAALEARQRVAASALVQGYVAELLPSVLAGLRDAGYLVRRLHRGVEEEFMPRLVEEVSAEIEAIITSRDVIGEIVREVAEARAELYGAAGERAALRDSPPDSLTPPDLGPAEEEARWRPSFDAAATSAHVRCTRAPSPPAASLAPH